GGQLDGDCDGGVAGGLRAQLVAPRRKAAEAEVAVGADGGGGHLDLAGRRLAIEQRAGAGQGTTVGRQDAPTHLGPRIQGHGPPATSTAQRRDRDNDEQERETTSSLHGTLGTLGHFYDD